jgi:hypothetical protein
MSKREHSISIRFKDEEFEIVDSEYQRELLTKPAGEHFTLSDMIRIKTLRPVSGLGNQRKTSSYIRRTA